MICLCLLGHVILFFLSSAMVDSGLEGWHRHAERGIGDQIERGGRGRRGGEEARQKKTESTLPTHGSRRPKLGGRLARRSPHPPLKIVPGTPPPPSPQHAETKSVKSSANKGQTHQALNLKTPTQHCTRLPQPTRCHGGCTHRPLGRSFLWLVFRIL